MTQEDKDLLLQDLCGRIPYGVKMNHIADMENNSTTLVGIAKTMITLESPAGYETSDIEDYIPYLFPLSSLTSSDAEAIEHIMGCDIPWNIQYGLLEWTVGGSVESETFDLRIEQIEQLMKFLNSHHIDYRGLIPMGLAIDCTNLNIY